MTDATKDLIKSHTRSIFPPIIVAIIVGMATAYLTVQETTAVQGQQIAVIEDEVSELRAHSRSDSHSIVRLQVQLVQMGEQLDRIESKLDRGSEE